MKAHDLSSIQPGSLDQVAGGYGSQNFGNSITDHVYGRLNPRDYYQGEYIGPRFLEQCGGRARRHVDRYFPERGYSLW